MTAFPDRRRVRAGLALGALAAALLAGPATSGAQAQGSPPAAPRVLTPRALEPPAPAPAATPDPAAPEAGSDKVRIDALRTVAVESVGVLGTADGGFGTDMWAGTPRAVVEALLARIPVRAASPAMRGLARRLLLSAATAPEGPSTVNLLALRASLLADMGDLEGVSDLLAAVAGRFADPRLEQVESRMRLLAGDHARACALAAAATEPGPDHGWPKLLAFCQVLAGEADRAALGVSLLRETGVDDPLYYGLMDVLLGTPGQGLPSMAEAEALHLAMATWAKVPVRADDLAGGRPAALRYLAASPDLETGPRLDAAERAEAAGALPTDTLRRLYEGAAMPEEALANPLTWAETRTGPAGRALLYRTAVAEALPAAQAEAMALAHRLGTDGGRYATVARVFLPVLEALPPSPEVAWFAPAAVRALLVGGAAEQATPWLGLMGTLRRAGGDAETSLTALVPLLRLAGAAASESPGVADWWRQARHRDGAAGRAVLLFALLTALGETVAEDLWVETLGHRELSPQPPPSGAVWHRLDVAAAHGRAAETVLLALVALGGAGPAGAGPVVTGRVVERLRQVGLEAEARRLAVEAAVAAGL